MDGYTFITDENHRVFKVSGDLQLKDRGRNGYQQKKSVKVKDGIDGDQGGHLIAQMFYGPGEQINYLAMRGNLNQGEWLTMEKSWKAALENKQTVRVEITAIFEGTSKRPVKFDVEYWIGDEYENLKFNN